MGLTYSSDGEDKNYRKIHGMRQLVFVMGLTYTSDGGDKKYIQNFVGETSWNAAT
jgi:hypothetical protein